MKRWLMAGLTMTLSACGGEPTTKGDVADMLAAQDTAKCVQGYSGGADNLDNWIVCVDAVSANSGRKVENVRKRVNEQQGREIFAGAGQP